MAAESITPLGEHGPTRDAGAEGLGQDVGKDGGR